MSAVSASLSRPSLARPTRSARPVARRGPVAVRAFGAENLIVIASTTAFLGASRFGLAPSSSKTATAGLKLVPQSNGAVERTGDPAGLTAADVLGAGALGHGVAVGIILGLRAIGKL